jgi:hypothetical protein
MLITRDMQVCLLLEICRKMNKNSGYKVQYACFRRKIIFDIIVFSALLDR